MVYKALCRLKKAKGLTEDLKTRIDILFAAGRITEEQYTDLMDTTTETEE